jgi:phthiodiolone/phenolphthiodiolone dimycocerosates ketoreductase
MQVGTMLPCVQSVELNLASAQAAAQLQADSVWLPDHLLGFWHPELWREFPAAQMIPDPDAFLDPFCLAAAIGPTTDLMVGMSVTDSCRRRAIDLVRCALTLNSMCRGRFVLGVGSGEAESTVPFGYDFSRPVSRLEQALIEIRSLLATGRMPGDGPGRTGIDRDGPHGVPEVWVAAQGGPRALRLAGRYGDGWIALEYDAGHYAEMLEVVRQAAADADRPCPTPAAFPLTLLGPSRDAIMASIEERPLIKLLMVFADGDLWDRYGLTHPRGRDARGYHTIPHELDPGELRALAPRIPAEMFEEWVMIGSGEEVAARLAGFAHAGCQHLVLADMSALAYPAEEAMAAMAELPTLVQRLREMVPV